jgi:hypothetical protein
VKTERAAARRESATGGPSRLLVASLAVLVASAALAIGIGQRGFWDPSELPPDAARALGRLLSPLDWGEEPPLRDAFVALLALPLDRPGPAVARAPSLLAALLLVYLAASEAYRRAGALGGLTAAVLVLASPLVLFEAQWGGPTMLAGALAAAAALATFDLAFPRPTLERPRPSTAKAVAAVFLAGLAGGGDGLLLAIAPAVVAAAAGDRELRSKRLSALAAPAALALVLFGVGAVRAVLGGAMFPPRAPFEWAPAIVTAAGMAVSLPLLLAYVRFRRLRETSFEPAARAIAFVVPVVLAATVLRDPAAGLLAAHLPAVVLVTEAAVEARTGARQFRPRGKLGAPAAFAGLTLLAAGTAGVLFAERAGAVSPVVAAAVIALVVAASATAALAPSYLARLLAISLLALVIGPFTRAGLLPLFDWHRSADALAERARALADETGRPLVVYGLDSPLVERALADRGAAIETTEDPVVLAARLFGSERVAALLGEEAYARLRAADPTAPVRVRHVAPRERRRFFLVSNRAGT